MNTKTIFWGVLGALVVFAIIFWVVKNNANKVSSTTPTNSGTGTATSTNTNTSTPTSTSTVDAERSR